MGFLRRAITFPLAPAALGTYPATPWALPRPAWAPGLPARAARGWLLSILSPHLLGMEPWSVATASSIAFRLRG